MSARDEFTNGMHDEMSLPKDTEVSHRVHSAKYCVSYKIKTLEEALKFYNITQDQYDRYQASWVFPIDMVE